jgi:hypothetical protein
MTWQGGGVTGSCGGYSTGAAPQCEPANETRCEKEMQGDGAWVVGLSSSALRKHAAAGSPML